MVRSKVVVVAPEVLKDAAWPIGAADNVVKEPSLLRPVPVILVA